MKPERKILLIVLVSALSYMFAGNRLALAATFLVNSNGTQSDADINDICETSPGNNICTLHAAIQEANQAPGSIILFTGQFEIDDCSLPAFTAGSTTINAYDQWDTDNDVPGVVLRSPLSCGTTNTILTIDSSNNHIYGIYFFGIAANVTGLEIASGSNNTIGTNIDRRRNVFLVGKYGIENVSLDGNNTISSNYFGTTDGDYIPSPSIGTRGIHSCGPNNIITNNLIGGQSDRGIFLCGNGNTVSDNIIGLDIDEQVVLPNSNGMYIEFGSSNEITNNTIGGNTSYGIHLGFNAVNNDIHHNEISTPWSISDLGNLSHGIYITSGAHTNTIRSNYIVDNNGSGIYASGSTGLIIKGNIISDNQLHGVHFSQTASGVIGGGSTSSLRNSVFSNSQHGIYLEGSASVTISGNLIGQDSGGIDKGNLQCGIVLDSGASANTIGGNSSADANWIGWNHQDGIKLSGSSTINNSVKNNILGAPTGFNWQAANKNNGIAIFGGAHDNTIGGTGAGNTVLASEFNGIMISFSDNNSLIDNKIGTDGSHDWGNKLNGIGIFESEGNVINANEIAYNSPSAIYDGIRITGSTATGNAISENSIHGNGGMGINLLSGANGSIAPPVITRNGGTVTGTTCSNCTVEFFTDAQDEGRFFEGSVLADISGSFSWPGSFQGRFITATATDSSSNTSMFSSAIRTPFPLMLFMPPIIVR